MKVIFLDFDGVLNCIGTVFSADNIEKSVQLSRERVGILNEIVKQTNAKIVISSSWRIGSSIETLETYLECFGLNCYDENMDKLVIDKTPNLLSGFRGREIDNWLSEHSEVEQYVILDDDCDMLPSQFNNFVNTKFYSGLTYLDAELAIAILNDDKLEIEKIKDTYKTFICKDIFNPDILVKESKLVD